MPLHNISEIFPLLSACKIRIQNPFDKSIVILSQEMSTEDTEKLTEISSNYELKMRFKSKFCHQSTFVWVYKYPLLAGKTTRLLLPVSTIFAKKHFLPMQIWKPSTEINSKQNQI